jgi:hypothetical protein
MPQVKYTLLMASVGSTCVFSWPLIQMVHGHNTLHLTALAHSHSQLRHS